MAKGVIIQRMGILSFFSGEILTLDGGVANQGSIVLTADGDAATQGAIVATYDGGNANG